MALLAFTCSAFSPEATGMRGFARRQIQVIETSLLRNLLAVAPSLVEVHFASGIYLPHMGF